MEPVIEVSHLSKQFKDVKAVDDLSFTVNKGDIYGFLGQNGAGKSTSIRMMLTLIKPTTGNIKIFGKSLHQNRSSILRRVGAVIEKPDMYKYLSAIDNLSIFAKMSGIRITKSFLLEQLAFVGLDERANSKVHTFSQGMKQRLGIAVALVHNPDLIILDEPTNGLDPQGIADIRNLILKLSHEMGKTVVVSSHLLHEIELIANRMIIIHKGKKITEGVVSELLDPAKSVIQIETLNDVETKRLLQTTKWGNLLEKNSTKLNIVMHKNDVPLLTTDLVNLGVGVLSISSTHALENYFLSLTNQSAHVEVAAN